MRRGVTLIEALMAAVVGLVLMAAALGLFRVGQRLTVQEMEMLGLQLDAQRALAMLLRDLQEGMCVVLPQPGTTLPYAVVRDKQNQLVHYGIVTDPPRTTLRLRRVLVTPAGNTVSYMMNGLRRMTFTAQSDGALRLHATLQDNKRAFAFHTQVRLRNRDAADL
jgi:hypothetical protein